MGDDNPAKDKWRQDSLPILQPKTRKEGREVPSGKADRIMAGFVLLSLRDGSVGATEAMTRKTTCLWRVIC